MELKRILARDTRSAMEQAIKTYGPDVLVISNHQVGGQTELVVAIEAPVVPTAPVAQAQETVTELAAPVAPAQAPEEAVESGLNFRDTLQAATATGGRAASESSSPKESIANHRTDQDARDYLRSREIVEMVRDEISALRREFRMRQQTSAWQSGLNFTAGVAPLAQALREIEMPGALQALLMESLHQAGDSVEGLQLLRDQLIHSIKRPAVSPPANGLHLLAGPSGSGKTLMAARLARRAARAGCDRVALISFQDVRAGAWSQMQMLASQLGVDAFRATDPDNLRLLIEELSHRALVLIDTPGIQMADHVRQVLTQAPGCQCHAVLPADASTATLQRVLGQDLPWQSLLITKVDEASSGWALLQFLSNNPVCISGASQGAGLNDLLTDFNTDSLVDLALAPLANVSRNFEAAPDGADAAEVAVAHDGPRAGLSAVLAGIAGLPAMPAFMATADILERGPRAAADRVEVKTVPKKTSKRANPVASAGAKPAKSVATAVAASVATPTPTARTRKTRSKTENAPAPRTSRRKVAEASARP